jgi:arylsulfatase A-like enzyme
MDDESPLSLTLYGAVRAMGLGLLVGGLEALTLPLAVALPLGPLDVALLGAISLLSFGLGGLGVALVVGLPIHVLLRRVVVSRGLAVQLALTALVLGVAFLLGLVVDELRDGRAWVAAGLLGFVVFLPALVFLFASRLFRVVEAGQRTVPFLPVAAGVAVLFLAGGAGLAASRDTGGAGALPDDPRVVLILVDGLRADAGGAQAPSLDRLAAGGAVFAEAVTPAPATAPAVASVLTGRPPLRHRVVRDGDRLGRYRSLLQSVFRDAGYATAGFVSGSAVGAGRGFAYGWHVFDDERGSPLPGLSRLRLVGPVVRALSPPHRPAATTVDRFLAWLDDHADVPFFAVIHLSEPAPPFVPHGLPGFEANGRPGSPIVDHAARLDETGFGETDARALRRLYQEEVAVVDAAIGRVLDALDERGLTEDTVVAVAGTGGVLLGEHKGAFTDEGLYDETLRVAMTVRIPGAGAGQTVGPQVRLHDLYPTVLAHAEIEPPEEPEAISLLGYLDGRRTRPLWTPVVGRDLQGRWTVGYRDNALKYLRVLENGHERLYDLEEDPAEATNDAEDLPRTLEKARLRMAPEALVAGELLGVPVAEP